LRPRRPHVCRLCCGPSRHQWNESGLELGVTGEHSVVIEPADGHLIHREHGDFDKMPVVVHGTDAVLRLAIGHRDSISVGKPSEVAAQRLRRSFGRDHPEIVIGPFVRIVAVAGSRTCGDQPDDDRFELRPGLQRRREPVVGAAVHQPMTMGIRPGGRTTASRISPNHLPIRGAAMAAATASVRPGRFTDISGSMEER